MVVVEIVLLVIGVMLIGIGMVISILRRIDHD